MKYIYACTLLSLSLSLQALPEKERNELETIEATYEQHSLNPEKLTGMRKALERIGSIAHLDQTSRKVIITVKTNIESLLPAAELLSKYNCIQNLPTNTSSYEQLLQKGNKITLETLSQQTCKQIRLALHDLNKRVLFAKACSPISNVDSIKPYITELTAYETDSNKNTPLHVACSSGNPHAVKALQEYEDLDAPLTTRKNSDGNSPLVCAARSGDAATMQAMLEWPGINVNEVDCYGNNLLWVAIDAENYGVIGTLLQAGFDITSKNQAGNSPLHVAAANKNKALFIELLKHNPLVNECNRWNQTPLDILLENHKFTASDADFVYILQELNKRNAPLCRMAQDPKAQLALKLDLTPQPPRKKSPQKPQMRLTQSKKPPRPQPPTTLEKFQKLLQNNQQKALRAFLQNDHNRQYLNFEDSKTLHPLIFAITKNNVPLLKVLIDAGSDVNYHSRYGHMHPSIAFGDRIRNCLEGATPLHFALTLKKDECYDELRKNPVTDLNATNAQDETILDFLISSDKKDTAYWFIREILFDGATKCKGRNIFKNEQEAEYSLGALQDGFLDVNFSQKKGIWLECTYTQDDD